MPPISQANKLHAVTITLQRKGSYHAIGFSDLVQLLVIKIKRLSFAQVVRRDRVSRARNTDYAVKTCEIFVVIVKIKRLYDYQTWPTHIWKIHVVRKVLWAFLSLLCFLGADWTGQDLTGKLHGLNMPFKLKRFSTCSRSIVWPDET